LKNKIKIPSKSKKKEIIDLFEEVVSHPEFIDKSQEIENMEEELIAGFEDEEDFALLRKEKTELKFWQ